MTVALDTTALIVRHINHPARAALDAAMTADRNWCASALALAEALALVDRLAIDPVTADELRRALRDDWGRIAVVPVDTLCLERASELARLHPVKMSDAIHLAAADRLPKPVAFATFDHHQMPVAEALGFEILSM
jgi:uncharacterized protein